MSRRDGKEVSSDVFYRINERVVNNSKVTEEIVDSIVSQYCEELDEYVYKISELLKTSDKRPIGDLELDKITLTLPTLLYFACGAQESLGIKEDMAKAIRTELFNQVHQKSSGTISDKNAAAELASMQETIVWSIYQRAYKKIKLRIESAYELLSSVKKVVSRRISEYELSKNPGGWVDENQ